MNVNISDRFVFYIKIATFVILGLCFLLLVCFNAADHSAPLIFEEPEYIEEWTITDPEGNVFTAGSSYRASKPDDGTFTITSELPENIRDDFQLYFITGGDVEVYIGGQLRKDFKGERDFLLPGGSVKRFYILVPLSSADSGAEVTMIRFGTTRRGYVYQETIVADDASFFAYITGRYGLSLLLAEILMLFSLVIVIISITMRFLYRHRIELLYGAMGIFVISFWVITNSFLYPFIYGHYHIDGVMNYLMCLIMPINLIIYLDAIQHGRHRKLMLSALCISLVNLLVWTFLHFSGILSFPRALIYIDIILGIQVLLALGVLVLEVVQGKVWEYRYTAIGFAGFMVCALFEILVLLFLPSVNEDVPMLIGLVFMLAMIVIQQIDDLKRLSDERQKAIDLSEAKTRFLASMSHEIRTPINAVLGMNEMILRENRDPVIQDYARSVKSSGRMLLMLVNDVLDFSRIEAGKIEITEAEYRLSSLLRDIMPILEERADEKGLTLKLETAGEIPDRQISDEFRIRQILINLINNGIKSTDEGSITVTISGSYQEKEKESPSGRYTLRFSVRDTGRGINEEDQAHLFEAFARADMSKNRSIEGTGLGLAIVKSIVDSMKGSISVNSSYGEGSDFIIELPVGIADPEPMSGDFMQQADNTDIAEVNESYQAKDAMVLAVDDTPMNLTIVKHYLKRVGIVPDLCEGGYEALEKCREKKYDLILLDHMMPDPDGLETLRLIRTDEGSKNRETVALVLTANAIAGSRALYLEAGFADYLTKPLDASLLEQTVRKFLPPDKITE